MPKLTTEQERFLTDLENQNNPKTSNGLTIREVLLMDGVPEEEIEQYLRNSNQK